MNTKIGLALSGGGFRGVAHLGVLQYLSELNIMPDEIAGASAGAMAGAFIAAGYAPEEIFQFSKKEKFFNYSDVSATKAGLFSADVFEKIIKKYIPHNSFEKLKTPLYVSVTDLTNAQALIFSEGDLSLAIKASCCFPLVFQPVLYNDNTYLCDGGLLNNFPAEQVRTTCNKVIGININPISKMESEPTYKEILSRIIRIATSSTIKSPETLCDVYLHPNELIKYGTFDYRKSDELFQLGYTYAKQFEEQFLKLKEDNK
ncbi:MAG: patatin-like phospholipase family protein [Cyclobacteriaceae bacterium]|nr:patatin-like phospholipase family protein [Cyclobacteriaceae bacterium]